MNPASTPDPNVDPQSRPNPYYLLGIVLVATPLLFGLLLFAMIATVVGEQRLEDSVAGTAVLFMPNVIGAALLLLGRRVPPRLSRHLTQTRIVIAAGATSVLLGLIALTQGREGDPNIGGSLLILCGLVVAVGAMAYQAFHRSRQPPPPSYPDG